MIEILLRRPDDYVGKFCDVLIEDEQRKIVELCYPEYLSVCSSENEPQWSDKKRKLPAAVTNEDWQGMLDRLFTADWMIPTQVLYHER